MTRRRPQKGKQLAPATDKHIVLTNKFLCAWQKKSKVVQWGTGPRVHTTDCAPLKTPKPHWLSACGASARLLHDVSLCFVRGCGVVFWAFYVKLGAGCLSFKTRRWYGRWGPAPTGSLYVSASAQNELLVFVCSERHCTRQ
jgi:hypothetical protein